MTAGVGCSSAVAAELRHYLFFFFSLSAVLFPLLPTFPPPASPFRTLLEQVDHWQSFLALVNMIMFCTGIPGHYPVNETVSSLTLTFWYTLQVRKRIRAFIPIGS